jgi:predicted transcriptional regulator
LEVSRMSKITLAVKLNPEIVKNVKKFCNARGIKYSFFVEKALREKLEREELKEDILELKSLRQEEKKAIPFEEYLKSHGL